jgi:hypothetical protein
MPSEAERITNEVMDRRGLGRVPSRPGEADSQGVESDRVPEVGPDFVNEGYMELERPTRDRYR